MSMNPSRTGPAILGAIILLAVIAAGCASPSSPAPTTTQATTAQTTAPATPAPTTQPPTTTIALTTAATTPPVATTTAAPTTPVPPGPAAVTIQNFVFNPESVTVSAGSIVVWTNQDAAAHQIVSDATPLAMTGALFMSGPLQQGKSFSFTFTTPGTYHYHCGFHSFMTGTVTVT